MAMRIEAVGSAVASEVGYGPRTKTNIVVDDPYEIANGSAWPYLNGTVIDLWATPPGPRDDIGEFRDWGDNAHLARVRPRRPPVAPLAKRRSCGALWQALAVDLGPIALKAPRWVIEGYATYVEGRVTGSGRPHGVWRPAFLREWALEGQLPRYDQLDGVARLRGRRVRVPRRLGVPRMARPARRRLQPRPSLAATERKTGPVVRRSIRRRVRRKRSRAVRLLFRRPHGQRRRQRESGFSRRRIRSRYRIDRATPVVGYRRSRDLAGRTARCHRAAIADASITRRDMENRRRAGHRKGKTRFAAASVGPGRRAGRSRCIRRPSIRWLRYDRPERRIEDPRFLRDGRVLLWRSTPRGDGSARPDLYLWNPARRRVDRLTFGASVREADPSSDGRSAIAVQCLHGWCDLVAVGLQTGGVRTLIAGGPDRSFYRPRMKPNTTTARRLRARRYEMARRHGRYENWRAGVCTNA